MKSGKLLTDHNLRVTENRIKVLNLFLNKDYALSQHHINKHLPASFDRVTLYRILNQFEESGIIHKIINQEGEQLYALCQGECTEAHHHDEHYHFYCENCEKTYCIDHVPKPKFDIPSGFQVRDYTILLSGVCKKCGLG